HSSPAWCAPEWNFLCCSSFPEAGKTAREFFCPRPRSTRRGGRGLASDRSCRTVGETQEDGPRSPAVSIRVEDLHKTYGETVAVEGTTFSVAPGEIPGLAGPNGAGKTTTLRALAGILKPTRGRLSIAGHDLDSQPVRAKAELAYVPDDPRLFDRLTVWEH